MRYMVTVICAVLLCAWLVFVLGCSQNATIYTPEEPGRFPSPDSPEQLMANFVAAYGGMDLAGYAEILHQDFRFVFQPCDVEILELTRDGLTREDELAIAANMFSGAPVHKEDGRVLPAISKIEFLNFEPVEAWRSVGEETAFPGTLRCAYQVCLLIKRPLATTIMIEGLSIYYVVNRDVPDPKWTGQPYYQLVGWVDLTEGCAVKEKKKANETVQWQ
jgi:hypothetical protein